MKLYLTAAGVYAGTQVEAKADGKGWRLEEVPTDKQGLIHYLNALKFTPSYEEVYAHGAMGEVRVETAQEQQDEVLERLQPGDIITGQRGGPPGHRVAERAALMGTSEEIALLADRIGELDGQALGQMALAVAARFTELGNAG